MSGTWRFWREMLAVSWRRAPVLTVGMFLVEVGLLLPVVGWALALRYTIDAAAGGATGTAVTAAVGAATVCTLNAVLAGLGGYLRYYAVDTVAEQDVRPAIARDIATLEGVEHLERGDFHDRVTVLLGASWGLVASLWSAVGSVFTTLRLLVSLSLLGAVSPWYTALVLFAGVTLWCDRRAHTLVNRAETETAESFRLQRQLFELATAPGPGKELRVADAAAEIARRQRLAWDDAVDGRYRARFWATLWRVAGWSCFALGFLAGLAAVVRQVSTGAASAGDAVLVITVAVALQQGLQATVEQTSQALASGRLIEPYLWLRGHVAAQRVTGDAAPPGVLTEGVVLEDVGYTYPGTERPALAGISVRLPAGSVVAVVGEYGSGKTTLVKLLNRFYRPTTGSIRVDGVDLSALDVGRWRARTSAAYQDFGRYQQTSVAESVGLGDLPRLADRAAVWEAVRAADAEALVGGLPDGLDTRLGTEVDGTGTDLSEGQWQKVALARAAMRRDPLLLVLDEPTASLDAPSEHAVFRRSMATARRLARVAGTVTVVVSHRFSTVTEADLILVLDQGRLVEQGDHRALLARGGRYAELYRVQAAAHSR
ncbi:ABC transporter ATP-binding protein [Streptomyces sp. DSM 44915]|uniref:ABC transporter ATP-binding protein n=1 Tax=Streptomyces chisholmiae TaxID=3075540 RepID=A0ABU2JNL6_9ACTN|nr:ABC transporter ATP-binding protein [Streptomyces sp. DSM 44915]MDT0266583.1 ABC transporter ATP-binding protein [Streptomyces sp. DSM 44915]